MALVRHQTAPGHPIAARGGGGGGGIEPAAQTPPKPLCYWVGYPKGGGAVLATNIKIGFNTPKKHHC